jgi:carboxymethylenebutenolidase
VSVPAAGEGRPVVLLHAWWGLNAVFREYCDRLAEAGFLALAPDLWMGEVAETIEGAEALRRRRRSAPTYSLAIAAVEAARCHPAATGATGVIGFSMGGHWALWLSQRPELKLDAAVSYYGIRGGDYGGSRARFLLHLDEDDQFSSARARANLERRLWRRRPAGGLPALPGNETLVRRAGPAGVRRDGGSARLGAHGRIPRRGAVIAPRLPTGR